MILQARLFLGNKRSVCLNFRLSHGETLDPFSICKRFVNILSSANWRCALENNSNFSLKTGAIICKELSICERSASGTFLFLLNTNGVGTAIIKTHLQFLGLSLQLEIRAPQLKKPCLQDLVH